MVHFYYIGESSTILTVALSTVTTSTKSMRGRAREKRGEDLKIEMEWDWEILLPAFFLHSSLSLLRQRFSSFTRKLRFFFCVSNRISIESTQHWKISFIVSDCVRFFLPNCILPLVLIHTRRRESSSLSRRGWKSSSSASCVYCVRENSNNKARCVKSFNVLAEIVALGWKTIYLVYFLTKYICCIANFLMTRGRFMKTKICHCCLADRIWQNLSTRFHLSAENFILI